MPTRFHRLVAVVAFVLAISFGAVAQEPDFNEDQMKDFLLKAEVVKSKRTSKGITAPYRLTLSDGKVTHDASFQPVNQTLPKMQYADGRVELNFVDSYKYNMAAYEVARLVGLVDMMPVTVVRKWDGKTGTITWWLTVEMDEESRLKNKIQPPDPDAWNKQMYKMRVFSQLVYDTDRNLGNVLISKDWKLYMIDFTRAFRLYGELQNTKDLIKCDKQLLEKLRALKHEDLAEATKGLLSKGEVGAVLKRRDKLVSLFDDMAKKSAEILY
jgi:hypothetical protein